MSEPIVVVGTGRMGRRHLSALVALGATVVAADPDGQARTAATDAGASATFDTLEAALVATGATRVVFSDVAEGRLERVAAAIAGGARTLLLEKPIEQSRQRVHDVAEVVQEHAVAALCNVGYRAASSMRELATHPGPFRVAATGGAWGLGCNAVHFIDLARVLARAPGQLVHGQIDAVHASPRGATFRDYGGTALYAFDDGTRLHLDAAATSSAPVFATVVASDRLSALDLHADVEIAYQRKPNADTPVFRYGSGYSRDEHAGTVGRDAAAAVSWLVDGGQAPLPTVADAVATHDLLFDLLETTGESHFPIT